MSKLNHKNFEKTVQSLYGDAHDFHYSDFSVRFTVFDQNVYLSKLNQLLSMIDSYFKVKDISFSVNGLADGDSDIDFATIEIFLQK